MFRLFRFITSRWFYAGILCMGLLVFGLTKIDVSWFRRKAAIGVSTSLRVGEQWLAPRKKVQDASIALVYANIKIGNDGSDSLISTPNMIGSPEWDDVSKALFFTTSLQKIFKTDIVWLISRADEKSTIMQTFLNQWETTIRQATITAQQLQSTIAKNNVSLVSCQAQKASASSRYNEWLNNNNASAVHSATVEASTANECIARLTTDTNSHLWVLDRLTAAINQTQAYISLIRSNQSTILTHGDLINSSTPASILQLQNDLSTIRNVSTN